MLAVFFLVDRSLPACALQICHQVHIPIDCNASFCWRARWEVWIELPIHLLGWSLVGQPSLHWSSIACTSSGCVFFPFAVVAPRSPAQFCSSSNKFFQAFTLLQFTPAQRSQDLMLPLSVDVGFANGAIGDREANRKTYASLSFLELTENNCIYQLYLALASPTIECLCHDLPRSRRQFWSSINCVLGCDKTDAVYNVFVGNQPAAVCTHEKSHICRGIVDSKPISKSPAHLEINFFELGSWSTDALQLCLQDKKIPDVPLRDDRDEIDQDLQLQV